LSAVFPCIFRFLQFPFLAFSAPVVRPSFMELLFVQPGVKIDGAYYREVLLTQKLLPAIRQIIMNIHSWVPECPNVKKFLKVG